MARTGNRTVSGEVRTSDLIVYSFLASTTVHDVKQGARLCQFHKKGVQVGGAWNDTRIDQSACQAFFIHVYADDNVEVRKEVVIGTAAIQDRAPEGITELICSCYGTFLTVHEELVFEDVPISVDQQHRKLVSTL